MPSKCITDRAAPLVEAASIERQPSLVRTIQQSRSDMVARGMSASSMHALEIFEACASELRERAKVIWQCVQRAHKSCGSKVSEDLHEPFRTLLLSEKAKLEQMQEVMAGPIVRQLQNMSLAQAGLVSETYDQLLVQYDAEIGMYLDDLKQGTGTNIFERLEDRFLNNPLVAIGAVIVVAIVGLASFTDALGKLSSFISRVMHNG